MHEIKKKREILGASIVEVYSNLPDENIFSIDASGRDYIINVSDDFDIDI